MSAIAAQKIRIRLKAYDHDAIDRAAREIVETAERDGYAAVQLAFEQVAEQKLSQAELGHLKKAGAGPHRTLVEFRDTTVGGGEGDEGDPKLGDVVTVSQFEPGQRIKVSGVGIGK